MVPPLLSPSLPRSFHLSINRLLSSNPSHLSRSVARRRCPGASAAYSQDASADAEIRSEAAPPPSSHGASSFGLVSRRGRWQDSTAWQDYCFDAPAYLPNHGRRPGMGNHTLMGYESRSWLYSEERPLPSQETFVIASYNVLADCNVKEHTEVLYSHIPDHVLAWEYRKMNIVKELEYFSPDIICLQEVDKFEELHKELVNRGYTGVFKARTGWNKDGCATFWKEKQFRLLQEQSIEFKDFNMRDNVAQLCVLQFTDEEKANNGSDPVKSRGINHLIVGNIHVLYNPKRGDIKLGQVRIMLEQAKVLSNSWHGAPVVIGGDFNSTPKSAIYNFLATSKLEVAGLDRQYLSGQLGIHLNNENSLKPPGERRPHPQINNTSVEFSASRSDNKVSSMLETPSVVELLNFLDSRLVNKIHSTGQEKRCVDDLLTTEAEVRSHSTLSHIITDEDCNAAKENSSSCATENLGSFPNHNSGMAIKTDTNVNATSTIKNLQINQDNPPSRTSVRPVENILEPCDSVSLKLHCEDLRSAAINMMISNENQPAVGSLERENAEVAGGLDSQCEEFGNRVSMSVGSSMSPQAVEKERMESNIDLADCAVATHYCDTTKQLTNTRPFSLSSFSPSVRDEFNYSKVENASTSSVPLATEGLSYSICHDSTETKSVDLSQTIRFPISPTTEIQSFQFEGVFRKNVVGGHKLLKVDTEVGDGGGDKPEIVSAQTATDISITDFEAAGDSEAPVPVFCSGSPGGNEHSCAEHVSLNAAKTESCIELGGEERRDLGADESVQFKTESSCDVGISGEYSTQGVPSKFSSYSSFTKDDNSRYEYCGQANGVNVDTLGSGNENREEPRVREVQMPIVAGSSVANNYSMQDNLEFNCLSLDTETESHNKKTGLETLKKYVPPLNTSVTSDEDARSRGEHTFSNTDPIVEELYIKEAKISIVEVSGRQNELNPSYMADMDEDDAIVSELIRNFPIHPRAGHIKRKPKFQSGWSKNVDSWVISGGESLQDGYRKSGKREDSRLELATGTKDNTVVQHSLNLRSAYSEIKGPASTRDASGEPQITSYTKQFMGTVDYLWYSDGLKPVRVLDTLPRKALTPLQGLPSQQFGSDHLALVSEMAFTFQSESSLETQ